MKERQSLHGRLWCYSLLFFLLLYVVVQDSSEVVLRLISKSLGQVNTRQWDQKGRLGCEATWQGPNIRMWKLPPDSMHLMHHPGGNGTITFCQRLYRVVVMFQMVFKIVSEEFHKNTSSIRLLHSPGSFLLVWGYWWLCQMASQGQWLPSLKLRWAASWCGGHETVGIPPPSAFYCHCHWTPHLKYQQKDLITVLIDTIRNTNLERKLSANSMKRPNQAGVCQTLKDEGSIILGSAQTAKSKLV